MNKIIWKDAVMHHLIWRFYLFSFIVFMLYVLDWSYQNINDFLADNWMGLIVIIYFSGLLIISLLAKTTHIEKKGLRIGIGFSKIGSGKRLKEKFIPWSEISNLKIIGRESQMYLSYIADYLVVKTKKGYIHCVRLGSPNKFVEILKKIKKINLLSKESKYRE